MARGKKTGGRNFVKGQSGNPAGRPPRTLGMRLQRALFAARWERGLYDCLMYRSEPELTKIFKDKELPPIERAIARYALETTRKTSTLQGCLDRLAGRPSEGPKFAPSRDVDGGDVAEAERIVDGELGAHKPN